MYPGLFHCLCGAISKAFSTIESSEAEANPVGSTFNIQNSIPHKSQKTKAVPETNRAKEFQRGTAGVPESVKEGATGLHEGSDIGLGPSGREFESPISDQSPLKSVDFRGFFFAYCDAELDCNGYFIKTICSYFSCRICSRAFTPRSGKSVKALFKSSSVIGMTNPIPVLQHRHAHKLRRGLPKSSQPHTRLQPRPCILEKSCSG